MSSKLALGALAAALLAFLVLSRTERHPGQAAESAKVPFTERVLALGEQAATPAPSLEPVRVPAVVEEESAFDPAPVPSAPLVTPSPRTGVFLVGDLLGLDELDPELVTISIRTRSGEERAASGTREGRYSADITGLLAGRDGPPIVLYVTAEHPAGRKSTCEFLLPAGVREASHYDLTEARLDLELLPRTAIAGRVQTCEGVEAQSVHVALVSAERETRSPGEPLAEVECDETGAFLLYPASGGDYVLLARASAVPPATTRVRVSEGQRAEAGVLRLEPGGLSIAGLVRVPFEDRGPWRVRAARLNDFEGAEVESWQGVDLRELGSVSGQAETDPAGAFCITGLTPGPYALELSSGAGVQLVLPYPALRVSAPASDVVLGESYGLVSVRVSATGSPAPDVQLRLALEGGTISRDGVCGEVVQVVADRRMPFSASAHATGFRSTVGELPALSRAFAEELELVLVPDTELATLRITWTLPAGLAAPDWVTAHWRRGDAQGQASVPAAPDGCRFEGWVAGHYRVTLEPCAEDCWELGAVQLNAPTLEVQLEPGGTSLVHLDWLPAGGVHFVPEPASDDPRETVHAEVRDAGGRALDVAFTHREISGGFFRGSTYTGSIPLRMPTELRPKPAPGLYELVLSEEARELARIPFQVLAGEDVTVPFSVP